MQSSAREDRRPVLTRIDLALRITWAVLGILAGVYWVHQVLRGEDYERQAENNRMRKVPVTAPRGFILDRNGIVLAENEPSFTLLLYRRETKDLDASLRFVAELFNRNPEELRRRVERDRSYYDFVPVVLQENLTVAEVGAVQARALEHPELVVQKTERRVYTMGTVAAHLLGQLGEATAEQVAARAKAHPGDEASVPRPGEAIGQQGVEAAYQDLLAGVSGSRSYVIDSFGREVGESGHVDPLPGNTLQLTIDAGLQRLAEDSFAGKVGSAIALDPKTGEILAMVSAPAYDPNLFTRRVTRADWEDILSNPDRPLNNRAIQNVYSPGSTWKPFMAYAILEHGIDPKERVFCPGGLTFYGRFFRCHGVHGSVDLATALQVSCDSYFYTMGKRLGIDAIAQAAGTFGFGRPTGIDLAHEKSGIVPSTAWSLAVRKHPWYAGETISVAIGQGPLLVSALQLARAMCGIANPDGALPTPHLFHIGENVRSGERFVYRPEVRESVSWAGIPRDVVLDGLWRVVNAPGGTAYGSRVAGLDLCGKTGSVQVVAQKEARKGHLLPEELRDHGWFVGFAPKDDPKIVVVVFAEHGEHGASAAAPLAAKMAAYWVARSRPAPPAVVAQAGAARPRAVN